MKSTMPSITSITLMTSTAQFLFSQVWYFTFEVRFAWSWMSTPPVCGRAVTQWRPAKVKNKLGWLPQAERLLCSHPLDPKSAQRPRDWIIPLH